MLGVPFGGFVDASTVDGSGTAVPPRAVLTRQSGFAAMRSSTDAAPPPVASPDFRFAAIFHDRASGSGSVPAIDIDAFSVGLDVIHVQVHEEPANPRGPIWAEIDIPPDRWSGMLASVHRPSGTPTGEGILARELGRGDGAAADVFDFVFGVSSATIPDLFLDDTTRAIDSGEMGLNDPQGTRSQGNLTALDAHLSAWWLDDDLIDELPTNPFVFFSVTAATVGAVPCSSTLRAARSRCTT